MRRCGAVYRKAPRTDVRPTVVALRRSVATFSVSAPAAIATIFKGTQSTAPATARRSTRIHNVARKSAQPFMAEAPRAQVSSLTGGDQIGLGVLALLAQLLAFLLGGASRLVV
jgi:hypothetical protein